ncbi:MAG: diacylglycerol/lipid kinase family protein [Streptosporangiaceae bacterium]
MASVAFVINQGLVRDRHGLVRRCQEAAEAGGFQATFAETKSAEDGLVAVRGAVAAGAGLVFAVGGDGTVRTCAQALEGTGVPLAIVPLGTANLVARALGVPSRVGPALRAGFHGRDRLTDLACVEDAGGADAGGMGSGGADGVIFAAMAGIGLDAAVVGAARGYGKRRFGWVAYLAAGVKHLGWTEREFTVRLDHQTVVRRRARCVVVGNVGLLPGGFRLLPEAGVDDGWLDVGILAPSGGLGWAGVAGRVLMRRRGAHRSLERLRARHVEISAAEELPRQIDGEVVAPARTLTVSVRPEALTIRQPR